jgi:hypothetical protein
MCCLSGWKLKFAGSRFTTPEESRYHPAEGEALAAAWALAKTKHFTIGCEDLLLCVDHKPLVRILGNRELADIENVRLLNFKEKTLRWNFTVLHIPGVLHKIADAGSRHPVAPATTAPSTGDAPSDAHGTPGAAPGDAPRSGQQVCHDGPDTEDAA